MVLAFLMVGAVGLVLLTVSLVVGEVFDGLLSSIPGDLLSGAAVAGFLCAFGFVGALVQQSNGSIGVSTLAGLGAGGVVGWGVGAVTKQLMKGGDEATVRTASLLGRGATVVNEIPDVGYGQVSLVVAGHLTRLNARSPEPIEAGTPVTVTAVLSPTSVRVSRAD
jgi:hypothetical protein